MDTMTRTTDPRQEPGRRPPSRRQLWAVAALVVAFVAVAAIVSDRSAKTPVVDQTAPAITAARPSATFPPVPAPASPDWPTIVRGILAVDNELRIRPNPALLASYMTTTNPSYADAVAAQQKLVDRTWRYNPTPVPPVVGTVTVVSSSPARAVLDVSFDRTPRYRVIDREGNVISDQSAGASIARWTVEWSSTQMVWLQAEATSL